jgi:hypothetical protein
MGAWCTSVVTGVPPRPAMVPALSTIETDEMLLRYAELRKSMALSEEDFILLYRHFLAADTGETGTLRLLHVLEYFDLEQTRLTRRGA